MKQSKYWAGLFLLLLISLEGISQVKYTLNPKIEHGGVINPFELNQAIAGVIGLQGIGEQYLEVGVAYNRYGISSGYPFWVVINTAVEINIQDPQNLGFKLGVSAGSGINVGLNLIQYTDFSNGAFVIRPEIGTGFLKHFVRLVYGFNSALVNKDFRPRNRHNFALSFILNAHQIKTTPSW